MRSTTLMLAAALAAGGAGCVPAAGGAESKARAAPTAGGRTVLIELFTSQGCSSCPAADAFVRDLPRLGLDRTRVVPLTFHIDYWDDLGWKDPFAQPAFTDRQRRYSEQGGLRGAEGADGIQGLYTPQMIVDGTVHFSGTRRQLALEEIRRAAAAAPVLDLDASATAQGTQATVVVRLQPRAADAFRQPLRLFVALAARTARTPVARGENRGETLEEAAIVRALSQPVRIDTAPAGPLTINVARPAELPWSNVELAVVAAAESSGHVLAARAVPLPPSSPSPSP